VEIRLKGGMPLLVGGQVAGSQTCCCENPPPPDSLCFCQNFCSYFIEVVEPSVLTVKHGPYACDGNQVFRSLGTGSLITDLLAFEITGQELFQPFANQSVSVAFNTGSLIAASVTHQAGGYHEIVEAGNRFGAFVIVSVEVYCCVGADGESAYCARVDLTAGAGFGFESLGYQTIGIWRRRYYGEFEIPSSCLSAPGRICDPFIQKSRHISTPLTITLSGDGTCSLGNLDMISDGGIGVTGGLPPEFPYAQDAVDDILDGVSYTFRITSRPTCRTVPADCDVPIGEGNTRVFWGGETPEFVLGTPELMSVTDPVTNDLLYYEHLGGIGTIVNPYKFFFYRTDNPNTQTLEQQYLDLYCESDNNVSPPVTAWYVVHQTIKYCAGPFTVDQWAGTIDTYAAPENCGNISAGDPVPIGEPTMERSIGYPQDSTGGCGATAPRIRFEIQAPCSV
jgi:hypothetical protein